MAHQFRTSTPSERVVAYHDFRGLDTTRSETNQDSGSEQVLASLSGGYVDEYGQIVRFNGFSRVPQSSGDDRHDNVVHAVLFNAEDLEVAWAYTITEGIGFDSTRDHRIDPVWPSNARVASTTFNGLQLFFARALDPYKYDGFAFKTFDANSNIALYKPSFCTTVNNRVVIAGIPLKPTQVHFSRTNQLAFYKEDEDGSSSEVTRAGYIDIQNLITRDEEITGLAQFETTRLAIFTQDRMILYNTDPNIENWAIDSSSNVNVGCISHDTIRAAGTDLLFCSRNGVHSVSRSRQNGILVYSISLSDRVRRLYKRLVASVADPRDIRAVWNQDEGHYHVLFPDASSVFTTRLTLSLNPSNERISPKWSMTRFLNESCGDSLGGKTIYGTIDGLYIDDDESSVDSHEYGDLEFSTPLLWHGSVSDNKQTRAITIQASGHGRMEVTATDEEGREIWSDIFNVEYVEDDNSLSKVPLSLQYERPFPASYRGVRLNFKVTGGKGLFLFSGFAIHIER